ncbi:hypothetical protein BCT47_25490 [Vibrio splendidus]|uniref:hypothetical protein n=1 Tax=Vibrio TaxID=662 RepID=UPI000C86309B|nr:MULTISPECIES: hypothetical protein [Vibrio]MCC4891714.1 hypothetical protein [Vibrio sp. F13]PMM72119.1 hypothetical protein BCT47_25490 [Vibrio splendidus]CAK3385119.1 DUF4234 domain-containing protein [Vibrio crassostreae]CAK3853912.1 DUF4234 domain-containing protein [Vibrio crassostreae]
MQSKTRVRLAVIFMWVLGLGAWCLISYDVLQSYLDLLNHERVVTFSPIALWLPIGGFGLVLYLIFMTPKAFYYGKTIVQLESKQTRAKWDKIILLFTLVGVAFASGWTYHTFDLMDKYGYMYSEELNRNAGTSIYRKWVRSM